MDIQVPVKISRSNDKKFICNFNPECRAAFSRSEHLQRHIRKHTGERPFSCECGRTFSRLDNLRQHAQTVHSGTDMSKMTAEQALIAQQTKRRASMNERAADMSDASTAESMNTRQPLSKLQKLNNAVPQKVEQASSPPAANPYNSYIQSPLDTPHETAYSTTEQTFRSFPTHALGVYGNSGSGYVPALNTGVEDSVGSQPISSLAKRRPNRHNHLAGDVSPIKSYLPRSQHSSTNATGLTNNLDYSFGRSTSYQTVDSATSTPSEGEQMSEYINNGQEPQTKNNERHMSIASVVHDRDLSEPQNGQSDGMEAMNMLSELAAQRAEPR